MTDRSNIAPATEALNPEDTSSYEAREALNPEDTSTDVMPPEVTASVVPSSHEVVPSRARPANVATMQVTDPADDFSDIVDTEGAIISPNYVYAIGTIDARFPNMGLEKEFDQALAAVDSSAATQTRYQQLYTVLSNPDYRYIARDICWVFSVETIDSYILVPRAEDVLSQFIEMLKEQSPIANPPQGAEFDVVIGTLGPIAPPEMCNGLQLPIALINNSYFFTITDLTNMLQSQQGTEAPIDQTTAVNLFAQLTLLSDNLGNLDEHRASNYLALRYADIYYRMRDEGNSGNNLKLVEVKSSSLMERTGRTILDVVFTFRNISTDVPTRYFVAVDATWMYPFLVQPLQPYYDRE